MIAEDSSPESEMSSVAVEEQVEEVGDGGGLGDGV